MCPKAHKSLAYIKCAVGVPEAIWASSQRRSCARKICRKGLYRGGLPSVACPQAAARDWQQPALILQMRERPL
jgi:hypothetical protein